MSRKQRATIGHGRRGFLALYLVLGLGPLLLLTFFAVTQTRATVSGAVNDRLVTSAQFGASFVRQELASVQSGDQMRARRPLLSAALHEGTIRSYDHRVVDAQLTQFITARQDLSAVYLFDPKGTLYETAPRDVPSTPSDLHVDAWLPAARLISTAYVSGLVSPCSDRPSCVMVATAVRTPTAGDAAGDVLGYLVASFRLDALQAFVPDFGRVQRVTDRVIDQFGTVVIPTPEPGKAAVSLAGDPRLRTALRGQAGYGEVMSAGSRLLSGYAPVKGIGWAVLVEVPAKAALADVTTLSTAVLTMAALLACVLLAGLVFLNRSLRARQRVEGGLLESEERFRAVFDGAPAGIARLDLEGRLLDANPALGQMLGRAPSALSGERLAQFVHRGEGNLLETAASGLAAGHEDRYNQDLHLVPTEGGPVPAHLTLSVMHDQSGHPQYLIASLENLTERAAAEMARQESEAKTRFLAAMSHELRTPLNSVLGFSQLLSSGDFGSLNARQQRYLGHIEESGRHLLAVISDLLNLSRIQAGEVTLESRSLDVEQLLAAAAESVAPQAGEKRLQLSVKSAPGLHVLADERALRQVLLNLLSNAIKFTPDGGRVSLAAGPLQGKVTISVSDTGIGIPADQLERIFEEFTQVESGLNRSQNGTGLGLAVCRNLSRLMHGDVVVSSRPGAGSTFTVRLPSAVASQRRVVRLRSA